MSQKKPWITFIIILFSAIFCFLIALPQSPSWLPGSKWFSQQKFHLGLDLKGGTQIIYEADIRDIPKEEVEYAVAGARDVIERRVNVFGVSEPSIQTSKIGEIQRIIVELPGIKNISEAIDMIGATPVLDFRELKGETTSTVSWLYTGLTGKYLKSALIDFDPQTNEPLVSLEFNKEGAEIFGDLTIKNVGKPIAIFLDNQPISVPIVREAITSGKAVITGEFTLVEAKELASRLSAGALPLPIKVIGQQNIGASLGKESVKASIIAGLIGLLGVACLMILNYGSMGVLSVLSLFIYSLINLCLFKLIPVTLTLPGVAGFILSIGMAVDANVLIFERMKEEKALGKISRQAIKDGFSRAWPAIRDGNSTTLIICFILFYFATGLVKGFAVTLSLGVIISMFSAIIITRNFIEVTNKNKK